LPAKCASSRAASRFTDKSLMKCPFCGHQDTQVKDSRPSDDGAAIRRRRSCPQCSGRFTTFERVQLRELMILKRNGRRAPFDRDKLERSLNVALRKRPVQAEQIEQLVSRITRQLESMQFQGARQTWKDSRLSAHLVPSTGAASAGRSGIRAMLVLRDNLRNRNRIERAYRKAIADARQEVLIASAYFLPGAKLRRALIHAARRGVSVRLLLQGRYEYFMQYHGARPVFGVLLAAGVEIHEYSAGFLHAKVAVVDGRWATVGSSNLDPLSLLLAREANVVVNDVPFAQELRACLVAAMETHGVQLDARAYAQRPWRQRLLDRIAFGIMRLLLFLAGRRY